MVWGTSLGSRHARSPNPDLRFIGSCSEADTMPATIPPTAQCANCETWAVLAAPGLAGGGSGGADPQLPPGWMIIDGAALCPDCAPPPAGALREEIGRKARPVEPVAVGPAQGSHRHGCRISHEIALGYAGIRIHGGESPPEGRDEAVNFIMGPEGLDKLIIELSDIRAKLVANKSRPS